MPPNICQTISNAAHPAPLGIPLPFLLTLITLLCLFCPLPLFLALLLGPSSLSVLLLDLSGSHLDHLGGRQLQLQLGESIC